MGEQSGFCFCKPKPETLPILRSVFNDREMRNEHRENFQLDHLLQLTFE